MGFPGCALSLRYIEYGSAATSELYHLATDPGELANLVAPAVIARVSAAEAAFHAAVARRMREYLAAMLARGARFLPRIINT